jgi:hypothetical protein
MNHELFAKRTTPWGGSADHNLRPSLSLTLALQIAKGCVFLFSSDQILIRCRNIELVRPESRPGPVVDIGN